MSCHQQAIATQAPQTAASYTEGRTCTEACVSRNVRPALQAMLCLMSLQHSTLALALSSAGQAPWQARQSMDCWVKGIGKDPQQVNQETGCWPSASIPYFVWPVRGLLPGPRSQHHVAVSLACQEAWACAGSGQLYSLWVSPCLWDPAWSSQGQQWPWPPRTMPADIAWGPQLTARAPKRVPAVTEAAWSTQAA